MRTVPSPHPAATFWSFGSIAQLKISMSPAADRKEPLLRFTEYTISYFALALGLLNTLMLWDLVPVWFEASVEARV